MAQPIEVVVNIPDKEYAAKLMSRAIADIIEGRINKLPLEQREKAYEILINELRKSIKEGDCSD
ncbi:hypothetical protein Y919_02690 [Caloranaerobacter azorensis H53214]|uniref:Uncharacterized protein n=1 Tax=Caloranaerobacter azorensis H53214 TaxID=1156417 RepID=A0A096BK20_9FIRM|nr:hypothetical protein [Caloranaerobacter azorensis]KGG81083.1 hypothetical protein Y919_02690 [Caloranaerobacter azorensis H53214]